MHNYEHKRSQRGFFFYFFFLYPALAGSMAKVMTTTPVTEKESGNSDHLWAIVNSYEVKSNEKSIYSL